ncbi:uncharacterized protein C2orf81 homolog [Dunckerocampus dactyliophorus]|uniref:uncharacterized protein C2orf81 homolog n=1 Tax=Dunckerocampus dactyliophorus TaxID=161453 RepID=UPI002404A2F1|nr:uncharacterized protein C2orf81 homolog [Dunckerocampus dactyliophorus]XP_054630500.1 uncharacterized protein C2orf81 homolog [Dunckerocampus dactyliophorus]XP_054630501.1 uncharacterized protein C2orf81 homolog [Dunckerocampus dactyliophorus]XP_054630502.1 uncharacterized protein C2orf81 homolog [Dunckerocampus dactyliophorus]XP_054630503.1 uncharacterized protein C2orf81 homolog [Dunckerocampus dactyliophorus]XP_054630504.1 uncharacterized protein C2orf81 homolog [Dunckerocampus dactyliop
MSRSAAKAQADKSKAPPRVSPPPPLEPEEEDIIPGCLTQSQWMDMLIQEEAEDVVGEIMAELMTRVMEGCYAVHIEKQLVSFTAYWAKVYFIQALEHHLMCRDKGEDAMESVGTEDSEPRPITPDVWSEGCFQVIHGAPQSKTIVPKITQEDHVCQALGPSYPGTTQQNDPVPQMSISPKPSESKISPSRSVIENVCKEPSPLPKQNTYSKKKLKASLSPKLAPRAVLPAVSCSAEKRETKYENKLPSVSKRTAKSSHQQKETRSIRKPDHTSLPHYWITPQYEILNNSTKTGKKSRSSKPPAVHNKQQTDIMGTSRNPANRTQPAKPADKTDVQQRMLSTIKDEEMIARALRLDTMHLEKGVSLMNHQRTEVGPEELKPQAQSAKLWPIPSDAVTPLFSLDQLTTGRPPQVTPLLWSEKFGL